MSLWVCFSLMMVSTHTCSYTHSNTSKPLRCPESYESERVCLAPSTLSRPTREIRALFINKRRVPDAIGHLTTTVIQYLTDVRVRSTLIYLYLLASVDERHRGAFASAWKPCQHLNSQLRPCRCASRVSVVQYFLPMRIIRRFVYMYAYAY